MGVLDRLGADLAEVEREARARNRLLFRLRELQQGLIAQGVDHKVQMSDLNTLLITVDLRTPDPVTGPLAFKSRRV